MQLGFVLSLVFAVIIAVFAVLNSDVVTIQLLFKKVELSQSVIILGSAALGAIIAVLFGIFKRFKTSLKIRELKGQIKELENNLEKIQKEHQTLLETTSQAATETINNETKSDVILEKDSQEAACTDTK